MVQSYVLEARPLAKIGPFRTSKLKANYVQRLSSTSSEMTLEVASDAPNSDDRRANIDSVEFTFSNAPSGSYSGW